MSTKYPLNDTRSPISREERNRINENWTRIMAYFEHVQSQIKLLAGGQEVDELIARLEDAINKANTEVKNYIIQVDQTVQSAIDTNNTAVQQAINANNTATQDAINTAGVALQNALQTVSNTLTQLNTAISNVQTATTDANTAKDGAITATNSANTATTNAQNAIADMQTFVDQLGNPETYDNDTTYYKNNIAEYNGSAFIALKQTQSNPPPQLPVKRNEWWQLLAQRGTDGNGSVSKVAGVPPESDGNVPLTKADIGLENAENTSDADKPISTATANALAGKADANSLIPIYQEIDAVESALTTHLEENFAKTGKIVRDASLVSSLRIELGFRPKSLQITTIDGSVMSWGYFSDAKYAISRANDGLYSVRDGYIGLLIKSNGAQVYQIGISIDDTGFTLTSENYSYPQATITMVYQAFNHGGGL